MKTVLIAAASVALLVVCLHGQTRTAPPPGTPPTLADIAKARAVQKQKEEVNEALDALHDLEALGDNAIEQKRLECLSAIGNSTFCACVTAEVPMGVNFLQYVGIVTRTKAELGYDTLSKNDKLLADSTYAAREVCVNRVFGKH
jgi:hypothetical protein